MSNFIDGIKLIYIVIIRNIRKIFSFIPIKKNRVFFDSFTGDGYRCNPKYISEGLRKRYGDKIELVWALKDQSKAPEYVITCKYRSFKHFIMLYTSKVFVSNYLQMTEIPKRNGQTYIQTWHGGGCYKTIGNKEKARKGAYAYRRDKQVAETDYFIASSRYFEDEVVKKQLEYKGKILEIGMPRNDLLLEERDQKLVSEIRKKVGIDKDSFAVIYAPTWRPGIEDYEKIDFVGVRKAFEDRFGQKCQMLFRAHLYGERNNQNVMDLTDYDDMNELLYACDAVITDYSSLMWDFCLTKRPCFLYTPDLKKYTEERGFDKDIYTWGFPVCENNESLKDAISSFDNVDYANKMIKHQTDLISFEKGTATNKTVDLIAELCGMDD